MMNDLFILKRKTLKTRIKMKHISFLAFVAMVIVLTSCASKKTLESVRIELDDVTNDYRRTQNELDNCNVNYTKVVGEKTGLQGQLAQRADQIQDLKDQIIDLKKQRENQMTQVGDLTVLSKTANDNIGQTIKQLENKDRYINLLQAAKNKTDSLNLALAINLKSVLKRGIEDEDIEVKVDKTVVYVNLSDKMMYNTGSASITQQADEVLSKIAQIIKSRPELDLMVEGYTDNQPIRSSCIEDNWDLSVKRATSVVRALQTKYGVNPDKLIAAGRGEYNTLANNETVEGRAINRRTRIILLPRLGQFYDLLNPANMPK
jgi:chemotaxis protein MotB